jgi:hypothetical protein
LGLVFLLLVSSTPISSEPTDTAEEVEFTPVTLRSIDTQSSAGASDGIEEATDAQLRGRHKPIQRGLRRSHRPVKHVELLLVDERIMRDFRTAPHQYLRFDEIPDFQARRALRDQGVLLTSYAGNNTYVAAVNARGRQYLDSAHGITEAGVIPIEEKVETNLLEGKIDSWARDETGRALVDVLFHKNVSIDDARDILELHGGVVLDDSGYPWYFVLRAAIDERSIPGFARADPVRNVSMQAPEPIPHNANAAGVSNVDLLWQPPYNLSGAGYAVGVWDYGAIYAHAEFGSRITYEDWTEPLEPEDYASHATHVAGTIGASGNLGTGDSQTAHGMANQVGLASYDYFGFNTEYVQAITGGLLFASNNGWGVPLGWDWYKASIPPNAPPQWVCAPTQDFFGRYTLESQQIDDAARIAEASGQTFPIVFSAGNERDDAPGNGECPWDLPGCSTTCPHDGTFYENPDETNTYYETIGPFGCAKNSITVGSISQDKTMPLYSSWGPCDDGRVKPDLVAKGDGLQSPYGETTYQVVAGTSMAAAVVTGSAVLVTEQFERTFATTPTNAELKALLINTAEDLGNPGPDYVYGFGLLQTQAAVDAILADGVSSSIDNGQLDIGQADTYAVVVPNGTPYLKSTLTWMDVSGSTSGVPALVNDLDLKLISPTAQVHFPYSLNVNDPVADATASARNVRDNVEQVMVVDPEVGTWTVEVRGRSVPSGPQRYGVVTNRGLVKPALYDYLPPAVLFNFPYPYPRPVVSLKYVDPAGNGIDVGSVAVRFDCCDVTADAVITTDGAYYIPTYDLDEDEHWMQVTVSSLGGTSTTGLTAFNIVEVQEIPDLMIAKGAPGETLVSWWPAVYDSSSLWLREYRIYRSTDLQQEMEWIGSVGPNEYWFTDDNPPVSDLAYYEVHGYFEAGSGNRVLSIRDTPHRTQQPFIAYPRDVEFEPLPAGDFEVRILGMAEPGSDVDVYADGSPIGSAATLVDGSFTYTHDFGGAGAHTLVVQAKSAEKSISVPSVEINIELLP